MQPADQNEPIIDAAAQMLRVYIAAILKDEWSEALLVAVIEDDTNGLTHGRFRLAEPLAEWRCFDTDYNVYIAVDAVRVRMRELLGEAWVRAEFTLQSNGAYYLSFAYSDGSASASR